LSLPTATDRVFADDGPLARALADYEPRAGQREMAAAVAKVFDSGGILLVEAGTGTGKTLAYLVPAILGRQRVLVSTGTKNLQEQIYFKDLPVLRDALGLDFTATYMKGRGNYLCAHRFDQWRTSAEARVAEVVPIRRLLERWAGRTETGDRAEVTELAEDLPLWSEISASSENCLGSKCPRYEDCFITRMRQRAAASDLVIVNHHLLCADAAVRQGEHGEVIPPCSFAVLDEAHQLEDVATQYFGIAVSNYRIEDLTRDGDHVLEAGQVDDADGDVRRAVDRVRDHGRAFFMDLQWARRGAEGASSLTAGDERVRITADSLVDVAESGQRLAEALGVLEATMALLKPAPEDAIAIGRRAGEIRDQLKFLLRAGDPDYVFYFEVKGHGVFLRAAPIDVSRIVRELLLDPMRATVLTSATLSVGGSFEHVRSRLGIGEATELRLRSEFDYARQAILYLPVRMPDPRSPGFAAAASREIVEILRRTRGRAFVLFTSYAMLRAVEPSVDSALDFPILVQGDAPRSALLDRFRSTPNAVLFATSSFWQGVDVIGEALSCVIIDKLPFASPADPITSARIEAIGTRGGEPFADYQVPVAILTLLQGLGRLIRHRGDRGVLAILDPRLRRMAYGRRFLEALPPAPITSNLADIERFFEPF
jgi:ATP-dependent DNA helicase DinG